MSAAPASPPTPGRPGDNPLAALVGHLSHGAAVPAMRLRQALAHFGWLDEAALDRLEIESSDLLGRRCAELVTRGLLTREQLARAVAHMAGLPGVRQIELSQAPPALLDLLFPPAPAWPAAATTLEELQAALAATGRQPIQSLPQALLGLGLLDARALALLAAENPRILREQHALLVRRGLLTDDELGRALARASGLAEVDALRFQIAPQALELLPPARARRAHVLPLGRIGDAFFVASGTPTDEALRRQLCADTAAQVLLAWADAAGIDARLQQIERGRQSALNPADAFVWKPPVEPAQRLEPTPADGAAPAVPELVQQAVTEVQAVQQDDEPIGAVGERSGMARLVRRMLADARDAGASDIHIEHRAADGAPLVRIRVDGELRPYATLPPALRAALVSRIKVMARLDISEHRRPQDGKISMGDPGQGQLEIRVAVLPTHSGMENVVLRLLGHAEPLPLASLGLQPRDEAALQRMAERSLGIILVVGPTGSGKTTTLHSLLMQLNTDTRKIWTVEDPIEITQPGLNQMQVNPKIGVTFATAMRSFLRADPDVIMVGEIRDAETAAVALEASLTGHLVLSTLHTNSAAETVPRLLELGVDPANFADALVGVVAQRLVRQLCPACRTTSALEPGAREALLREYVEGSGLSPQEGLARLMQAAGVDRPERLGAGHAPGCPRCAGKGYKGRMGVYEILQSSPALQPLVRSHAPAGDILRLAVGQGMRTLRHDALEKVVQGRLDLLQARAAYL